MSTFIYITLVDDFEPDSEEELECSRSTGVLKLQSIDESEELVEMANKARTGMIFFEVCTYTIIQISTGKSLLES